MVVKAGHQWQPRGLGEEAERALLRKRGRCVKNCAELPKKWPLMMLSGFYLVNKADGGLAALPRPVTIRLGTGGQVSVLLHLSQSTPGGQRLEGCGLDRSLRLNHHLTEPLASHACEQTGRQGSDQVSLFACLC